MNLRVAVPETLLVETEAVKVVAEAADGSFCLKPRHRDMVSILVPGLLGYTDAGGDDHYLAVDRGVLVKKEGDVLVSVRQAIQGDDLGRLHRQVEESFLNLGEREQRFRFALRKIETEMLSKIIEAANG